MDTKTKDQPTKEQIVTLLYAWIRQRPGLEFGNYGDVTAFRSESRSITRQYREARELLRAVELAGGLTAAQLMEAFPRAFSGRLTLAHRTSNAAATKCPSCGAKPGKLHREDCTGGDHRPVWMLDYCTGQYWPTEYRAAACAVLAAALWDYARENMPAPKGKVTRISGVGPFAHESEHDSIDGLSPGDWLRKHFRREFGAHMQKRWFD